MNSFYEYDTLCHYGVLGMKWGVRRYQNYDGTLIKSGSAIRKKTKYTNIDGSLNEKGKVHSQAYINKQIKKNEKYYAKHIKKYEKLAEKYKDNPEMKKKFEDMKTDAIRTRDSVNANIKTMGIDEIMANETEARQKAIKTAAKVAGVAGIAATGGVAAAGIAAGIGATSSSASNLIDYAKNFNYNTEMSKLEAWANSDAGRQAERIAQTPIRAYSDVKAYVASVYLDQTVNRMRQEGVPEMLGGFASDVVGNTVNKSADKLNSANLTPFASNITKAANQVINDIDYSKMGQNVAQAVNEGASNINMQQLLLNSLTGGSGGSGGSTYKPSYTGGSSKPASSGSTASTVANAVNSGIKIANSKNPAQAAQNLAVKEATTRTAEKTGSLAAGINAGKKVAKAANTASSAASAAQTGDYQSLISQALTDPNYLELLKRMGYLGS